MFNFKYDFEIGKKYLKKAGTNLVLTNQGMKVVMEPGSAYEDVVKEKLPEKFFIEGLNKEISLSKDFIKEYQLTHRVDLDRLMRGCSILITKFNGPESDDHPKIHHKRLFEHFMITQGILAEGETSAAIMEFGKVRKLKLKKIKNEDYIVAAQILGDFYKIWNYDAMSFMPF